MSANYSENVSEHGFDPKTSPERTETQIKAICEKGSSEMFALSRVLWWTEYVPRAIDGKDADIHRIESIRYWVTKLVQARNGRVY